MNLTAVYEDAEEGGFVGWFEEMPDVFSQGETKAEVEENLMDALQLMLACRREAAELELRKRKTHYTKEIFSLSLLAVA